MLCCILYTYTLLTVWLLCFNAGSFSDVIIGLNCDLAAIMIGSWLFCVGQNFIIRIGFFRMAVILVKLWLYFIYTLVEGINKK